MRSTSIPEGLYSNRFAGRRVVVTGAASGIGRAAAQRFASEGATVVAMDCDQAVHALAEKGSDVMAYVVDQADEHAVNDFFARFDPDTIDVLCINAAIAAPLSSIADLETERWRRVLGVNLDGSFFVARAATSRLRRHCGGSIVFTSSTAGLYACPELPDYGVTKAGVISLARSMALELAPLGIRVNTVCPGSVRTSFNKHLSHANPEARREEAARKTPLGRIAEPEDIAGVIAFLASEDARHVTAACLVVDGGQSAGERT